MERLITSLLMIFFAIYFIELLLSPILIPLVFWYMFDYSLVALFVGIALVFGIAYAIGVFDENPKQNPSEECKPEEECKSAEEYILGESQEQITKCDEADMAFANDIIRKNVSESTYRKVKVESSSYYGELDFDIDKNDEYDADYDDEYDEDDEDEDYESRYDDDWDNSREAGGLPRDLSPFYDIDDPYEREELEYEMYEEENDLFFDDQWNEM